MSQDTQDNTYDFGPYEDEYQGVDMRSGESGRGPLILILALGVLLIFAGVVWNTYRQGVRGGDGSLPVLMGDGETFKRAPDNRGGLQVDGQDSGYYNQIDGMGDPARLRTYTQLPQDGDTLAGGREADLAPASLPPSGSEGEGAQIGTSDAPDETVAHQALLAQSRPVPLSASDREAGPADRQPKAEVFTPLQDETIMAEELPARIRFDASGAYQVQLSALRSEAAALTAWRTIQGSKPALYQGGRVQIQKADLGAQGVFYRLRVGAFSNRERADMFCAEVKATGQDCMVVARSG